MKRSEQSQGKRTRSTWFHICVFIVFLRRVSHLSFLTKSLCFFTLTLNTSVINVHFLFLRVIFTQLRGQTKSEAFMSSPFKEHLAANHSSYPMKEQKKYETKYQSKEVHVEKKGTKKCFQQSFYYFLSPSTHLHIPSAASSGLYK